MSVKLILSKEEIVEIEGAKFTIKVLDAAEEAAIQDKVFQMVGTQLSGKLGSLPLAYLEAAIINWENVLDEKDQPIPFKKELIRKLPRPVREELTSKILGTDKLTPEETKNLEA